MEPDPDFDGVRACFWCSVLVSTSSPFSSCVFFNVAFGLGLL
jgi:hypothetical protein